MPQQYCGSLAANYLYLSPLDSAWGTTVLQNRTGYSILRTSSLVQQACFAIQASPSSSHCSKCCVGAAGARAQTIILSFVIYIIAP